jgi:PKD repeat protein
MRLFIFIFLISISNYLFCQKQTAIWFFGRNAGLDFNYIPPKPLLNGKIDKEEGNGCLSDKNGKLLYYTDGDTIWDFNNYPILNGSGLKGRSSATQGSLILTHPDNQDMYYVFTNTDGWLYDSPLYVNIVSDNKVLVKNNLLIRYGSEKINAVNHKNNKDIWVSTHSNDNDTFYFFLLKREGIIDCPVIQRINKFKSVSDDGDNQGQIKFSSDGSFICANNCGLSMKTFIGSFNNEAGRVGNSFILNHWFPYSSEFSNNSKYLYVCDRKSSIYQYNLTGFDSAQIMKSKYTIKNLAYSNIIGMQLAFDRKIYIIRPNANSLDVITNPDSSEANTNYKDTSQFLGGRKCAYALPNFNQSYFYTPSIDYAYEQDCRTNTIVFEGKDTIKATSYKWVFSKGTKTDTRSTKDASYTFTDTGKWDVKYIASNGSRSDTVSKSITIRPKLEQGFLGEDKTYCQTLPILKAPKELHCMHWYNDIMAELSKIDSFKPIKEGTYYAKATNLSFCMEWDTIRIIKIKPRADFETKDICQNDSAFFINTSEGANNYNWKFGDGKNTLADITAPANHKYPLAITTTYNVTLVARTDGCSDSITKQITVNENPDSDFSYKFVGNTVYLKASKNGLVSYKWNFGKTDSITTTVTDYNKIINVSNQKNICLKVTNLAGCVSVTCKDVTVGINQILEANDIKIYPNPSKGKISIEISKAGNYSVKVYNEIGQLVFEKRIKGNLANTLLLKEAKGNYMVEIVDEWGGAINKKVVVE